MPASDSDILFDRRGAAGLVTLNRSQSLNAVSHGMVRALAAKLAEWQTDAAVTRVVVTANGGRAFSAGGDLRGLYELGRAGRYDEALTFFREEYLLNATIKHYRKPYISLIDGIVMGGGAGISVHGSHRVAGDRFTFAMPEVSIGFFPDIGATWFLTRMGELGRYCALTGERLNAADGVGTGIATHRVASSRFPELLEALCGNVPVDAILGAFAQPAGEGPVVARRPAIDRLFDKDRIEDILAALDKTAAETGGPEAEFARATVALMRTKSPTSLKLTLRQLRLGKSCDFDQCMRTEYRIVSRVVRGHDLYEGIRAVIIDKDQTPRWQPAALQAVGDAEVERYFAPIAAELQLP